MPMKNPLTPAGIETATFRFVAQHVKHCVTAVSQVCSRLYCLDLCKYTLWHSHNAGNHLTTRFSERIPVVKLRMTPPPPKKKTFMLSASSNTRQL